MGIENAVNLRRMPTLRELQEGRRKAIVFRAVADNTDVDFILDTVIPLGVHEARVHGTFVSGPHSHRQFTGTVSASGGASFDPT